MSIYTNEDLPANPEIVQTGSGNVPKPRVPLLAPPELINNPPIKNGHIVKQANVNGGFDYICNIGYFVDTVTPYNKLIETLLNATEKDVVIINIYSYGGSVETGMCIINAMKNTKANYVITRAYGICASIGAVIWACGTVRLVARNATLMFHMPSGGAFGKTLDNEEESSHINQYFAYILGRVTTNVLTKEQLDKVIGCRCDIFIPAEQVPAQPIPDGYNAAVAPYNKDQQVSEQSDNESTSAPKPVEPVTETPAPTPQPTPAPQPTAAQPTEGGN